MNHKLPCDCAECRVLYANDPGTGGNSRLIANCFTEQQYIDAAECRALYPERMFTNAADAARHAIKHGSATVVREDGTPRVQISVPGPERDNDARCRRNVEYACVSCGAPAGELCVGNGECEIDPLPAMRERITALRSFVTAQRACLEALVERVKKEWSSPEEAAWVWEARRLIGEKVP